MIRDSEILFERIAGLSYRQIGRRHGTSHEYARHVYGRARERYLDALVAGIGAREEGDSWELGIPPPFRDDPDAAARYVGWVIGALVERGISVNSASFVLQEVAP